MTRHRRWSDDDRTFGPFTLARGHRQFGALIDGGGDGYGSGCAHVRVHLGRLTSLVWIPQVIRPGRQYGATLVEGAVHFRYGAQTFDSQTDKSKCWFVPWLNWRHVRTSLYGLRGEHVRTEAKGEPFDEWYEARRACPSVSFEFLDFDGERISARTHIEEHEWRFGTGRFSWLSFFRAPMIRRSLDIEFSKETGPRKGSWKGGTVGHGIDMFKGELHESAFLRYCMEHNMEFVGEIEQ